MTAHRLAVAGMSLIVGSSLPALSAGHAPSQAAGPLGVAALAGKYTGAGITIGVISDSFSDPNCDPAQFPPFACATTADQDIATGNLPGPGNPNGDTTPVIVIQDGTFKGELDTGRAMLQIIYGLAPKARLCFATWQSSFTAAVASLASPTGPCKANVIVDDGVISGNSFFAESDDTAVAAIEQAVAAGVTFVTAAGDIGPGIYDGAFKAVPDSVARAGTFGNLDLSQVPAALTAGGFHDFSTGGTPQLSFGVSPNLLSYWNFGWDDLASPASPIADYHLLFFDDAGNYVPNPPDFGGPPVDFFHVVGRQIAISLGAPATSTTATRLRIVNADFLDFSPASVSGLPAQASTPSIFAHASTASAISVSSYRSDLSAPEPFNSQGPFTNVFDSSGKRLATPETRLKPDVAGVDGLDATFGVSGSADSDQDGFPNVFGSAIAAASVAAVAALTIEAADGKAAPAQVSGWLKQSASHSSRWAASDGYGYVNAVKATGLAASARSGCGTVGSLAPSWMLAVLAVALLRRRRLLLRR
jgi:uncharacterized protein (TIGR03382 family)